MKKYFFLAIPLMAALTLGFSINQQPEEVSLDEQVVTKTWQALVSDNFSNDLEILTMGLQELYEDALDAEGDEFGDYSAHFSRVRMTLNQMQSFFFEQIDKIKPYTVEAIKEVSCQETFDTVVGTPKKPVVVDTQYFENLFLDYLNNAVFNSPVPVVKSKVFDKDSNTWKYTFENTEATANAVSVTGEDGSHFFSISIETPYIEMY